jgi:hypothetical protein
MMHQHPIQTPTADIAEIEVTISSTVHKILTNPRNCKDCGWNRTAAIQVKVVNVSAA